MQLIYFAWIRESIGRSEETLDPPDDVTCVADLLIWLMEQGPEYAAALARPEAIKVAVNQEFADPTTTVGANDEIALFPPVTGG